MRQIAEKKRRTFTYLGQQYTTFGNIKARSFHEQSKRLYGNGSDNTPCGYTYDSFYEMAQKMNAVADIYLWNETLVIPATYYIFQLNPEYGSYSDFVKSDPEVLSQKQVLSCFLSGHYVEITIESVNPPVKIVDFCSNFYDEIEVELELRGWNGGISEVTHAECENMKYEIPVEIHGFWRLIPDSIRIANWKKHATEEDILTENDFVEVFPNQGSVYFHKWNDDFLKNESSMIDFLGYNTEEAYLFTRLLMDKVEEYDVHNR